MKACHYLIACLFLASLAATSAFAAVPSDDFLRAEREALSADSGAPWDVQAIGGGSIGGVGGSDQEHKTTHFGRKLKAGLLSLALPGAGQLYNGNRDRALLFAGSEAAIWTGYLVFHFQAKGYVDDYRQYAHYFAGVQSDHHPESYWRALGRYMESDEYLVALMMELRAEGLDPNDALNRLGPEDAWFWRSEGARSNYQELRANAARAYNRRDFMILFMIINRAVAAYDAVRGVDGGDHQIQVGGLGLDIAPVGAVGQEGTACVATFSF